MMGSGSFFPAHIGAAIPDPWSGAPDGTWNPGCHIAPNTDDTYDLGTSALAWRRAYIGDGTEGLPAIVLGGDTTSGWYRPAANQVACSISAAQFLLLDDLGLTIIQPVVDGATPTGFVYTGGAHTACLTTAEVSDFHINAGRTITWATGGITNNRTVRISPPTLAFAAASTVDLCSTLTIDGPPVAGANATLTEANALHVVAGTTRLGGALHGADGTVGAPGISFQSQKNCGLYVYSTTNLAFAANGVSCGYTGGNGWVLTGANTGSTNSILWVQTPTRTNMTASTEVPSVKFDTGTYAYQWATGALATQRDIKIDSHDYSFVGASTVTDVCTVWIEGAPGASTNATFVNPAALRIGNAVTIGPQSATLTSSVIDVPAHTTTVSGTTQVTSACGVAGIRMGVITVTNGDAGTIDVAAGLYIAGPPVAAGSTTITAAHPLFIDSGTLRYDANVANDGATDTCTLGKTGNNGPSAAAQAIWMKINMAGTEYLVPGWSV